MCGSPAIIRVDPIHERSDGPLNARRGATLKVSRALRSPLLSRATTRATFTGEGVRALGVGGSGDFPKASYP